LQSRGRKENLMPQKTRDVMARLEREGWQARAGKGDHRNYRRQGAAGVITIDTGTKEIPPGTYSKIAKIAGWK
jgi:predicted RNA binding protein YcfA (HicA-like mRNA interferase family)